MNKVQTIKQTIQEVIDYLKIKAEITVAEDGEGFKAEISSDESSLIIGVRGQNLYSLEHLIRVLASKRLGEHVYINLDISGYKERRNKRLEEIVTLTIEKVKKSKKPIELESMSASERKLVHTLCQSIEGIISESAGEGMSRRVVIKISE